MDRLTTRAWRLSGPAFAAVGMLLISAGVRAEPITPAQALSYTRVGDMHFSPDGSKLVYVESSYLWDAQPHIWITDLVTHGARQITPAARSERSPQWSPDGKRLAFLSNRSGKTQVYVTDLTGGDATALTDRKYGVTSFHWSPNGLAVAYLAKDDETF